MSTLSALAKYPEHQGARILGPSSSPTLPVETHEMSLETLSSAQGVSGDCGI